MDMSYLTNALKCTCPKCGVGALYHKSMFDLSLLPKCTHCGLNFAKNDSADGPAVFLIFILGFLIVPMALLTDSIWEPPMWVHAIVWGSLALGLTVGSLKPLKSMVIAIQYRHRPTDWDRPS